MSLARVAQLEKALGRGVDRVDDNAPNIKYTVADRNRILRSGAPGTFAKWPSLQGIWKPDASVRVSPEADTALQAFKGKYDHHYGECEYYRPSLATLFGC